MTNIDVAIIGGGAAGYFAAIRAAEMYPKKKVIILEKTSKILQKVKISGGGRCNVTNACFDIKQMIANYPRGGKELQQAFSRFFTSNTINWFNKRGVELHTEADNRVFPISNSSQTIIDCLERELAKYNGKVWLQCEVMKIMKHEDGFIIDIKNKDSITTQKIIVTSGGNNYSIGYNWLEKLGHQIISPIPSLFTFNLADKKITSLMGVSLQAAIKISNTLFESEGPLLITHWGFSGPSVLKLSAFAAQYLHERNYEFNIEIDFLPQSNTDEIIFLIKHLKAGRKKWIAVNKELKLPNRLFDFLLQQAKISPTQILAEASNKLIQQFATECCHSHFTIKGKTTFKEEFVTCGGIALSQVDFKTMESKICKNIFFAGEVLNIDGITGGFNFQAAWTTGYIAGGLGNEF